jgi:hypothetical protein
MAITQVSNGALAAIKVATGAYLDSASSPAAAAISCGFIPSYILFVNLTDRIKYEWFDGMTVLHSLKTAVDGTMTEETTGGFTPQQVPATSGSGTGAGTNSPGGVTAPLGYTFGTITQNKQYYWYAVG